MQAAYEAAYDYAANRVLFGRSLLDYQLTRAKLTRMAVVIPATRQFAYRVARLMAAGAGRAEAAMVKAYACQAAEWVTREAMQIHGGMGYAEEFPVSRRQPSWAAPRPPGHPHPSPRPDRPHPRPSAHAPAAAAHAASPPPARQPNVRPSRTRSHRSRSPPAHETDRQ